MKKTDPAVLLSHGVHLGHKKTKVHPKSKKYIHKFDNGTSIIDLFQTAELLEEAKKVMFELGKDNKDVLFVGTKKVAREPLTKICKDNNLFYMTNKWVGGFLTNFGEISKNIKQMNEMSQSKIDGSWSALPKHEIVGMEKKLNKIASIYGGVKDMKGTPDALFILDIRKEKNALNEATQLKVPSIAVTDTNVNPDTATHAIPANDDAVTSVNYIIDEIVNAYLEGRKKAKSPSEKEDAKAEEKPAAKKPAKKEVTKKAPAKKATTKAKKTATKKAAVKK